MIRPVWLLAGGTAFLAGTAASFYAFYVPPPASLVSDDERRRIFERNAADYDSRVNWQEYLSGISTLRHRAAGRAAGRVLEIGAGTGRNLDFYKATIDLVLADYSEASLRIAEAKFRGMSPSSRPSSVSFALADASRLPFGDATFDAAIDTFGLCSYEDPVAVLRELRRVVRRGGRVVLLEHGAGNSFVDGFLDRHADRHAARHGCYWNRRIDDLVRDAGLRIVVSETRHAGTTRYLECLNE